MRLAHTAIRAITLLGLATVLPARAQDIATANTDPAPFTELTRLPGASVQRIAVDPHDASRYYVDAQGGRIARTTTGGAHWEIAQVASTSEYFRAIAVDPADSSIVLAFSSSDFFAGPPGGVYESRDFGAHWFRLPHQPSGELGTAGRGRGIVVDPRGRNIVVCDRSQGIFYSADFGRTWTNPLTASQANTFALTADPNDPATVWTGGRDAANSSVPGLWVSHDFGRTWTRSLLPAVDPAQRFLVIAIGVQPGTSKVLVATDGNDPVTFAGTLRFFASLDGGKTWTDSSGGLDSLELGIGAGNSIVFDPASADIVYTSLNGDLGLLRSTDGGASWSQVIPRQFDSFFTLAAAPSSAKGSGRILAGGASFYTSSDRAATWTRREAGLVAQTAFAVVDDGWRLGGVYATSTAGAIAHSWNGGKQWRAIDPEPDIRDSLFMVADPASPIHPAYVMTSVPGNRTLWRSIDLGHHWSRLDTPADFSARLFSLNLAADPRKAGRLYVLLADENFSTSLFRSDDFGEHWSRFAISTQGDAPAPIDFGILNPLVPDPARPGTLYVAMFSGLWRSTDAGASWQLLEQLPLGFFGVVALAVTDGPTGGVYVETDGPDGSFGLEKSSDGGTTWTPASSTFEGEPFLVQGGPAGRLFAYSTAFFSPCFEPHVQQSTDGAVSWSELAAAGVFAQFQFAQCPTVIPTATRLYVGDPFGSRRMFDARYGDLTEVVVPRTASVQRQSLSVDATAHAAQVRAARGNILERNLQRAALP